MPRRRECSIVKCAGGPRRSPRSRSLSLLVAHFWLTFLGTLNALAFLIIKQLLSKIKRSIVYVASAFNYRCERKREWTEGLDSLIWFYIPEREDKQMNYFDCFLFVFTNVWNTERKRRLIGCAKDKLVCFARFFNYGDQNSSSHKHSTSQNFLPKN